MHSLLRFLSCITVLTSILTVSAQTIYTSTSDGSIYTANGQETTAMPYQHAAKTITIGNKHFTTNDIDSITFHQPDLPYLGGDISLLPDYEAKGAQYLDLNGKAITNVLDFFKSQGWNCCRMRLFVDPTKASDSDKKGGVVQSLDYVKALGKKIKEAGFLLMLDFHYSDWWADPAKQNIPAAWSGHDYRQMKQDLWNHTVEVLNYLKDNNVTPKWIQVGNETRNGFLWSVESNEKGWPVLDSNGNTTITESMGHVVKNPEQYAGFFSTGYDACKSVFPESIVMVHLDNGFDKDLYDFNLGVLKDNGAKWDMIGMSLYPYWALDGGFRTDEDQVITDCIENIKHVSEKFGCDVMIVETGYPVDENDPERMERSRSQLARTIREAINNTDGHCKGVFYWEPECKPSQYKLGAFTEDGHPTIIMDAFKDWED